MEPKKDNNHKTPKVVDNLLSSLLIYSGVDFSTLLEIDVDIYDALLQASKDKYKHNKQAQLLKTLFWNALDKARENRKQYVDGFEFYSGVCLLSQYERYLKDELFCIYLLEVEVDYDTKALELLNKKGIDIYEQILDTDNALLDKQQVEGFKLKIDALKRLEDRARGAIKQKIDINQNTVMNSQVSINHGRPNDKSLDDLRTEILALEEALGIQKETPGMIQSEDIVQEVVDRGLAKDPDVMSKVIEIEYKKSKLGGNDDF